MNRIEVFNQALFLEINAGTGTQAWIIDAAIFIANDLIYLIPLVLLAMWLWGDSTQRNLAIKACLVAMLGVGLNQLIGVVWPHPRPFMVGLGHAWLPHAPDSSFPSDHMTVFAGVGLPLLLGGAVRLGLATLVVGLCVAWARVFLGVHFPLDMLGAVCVACTAFVVVSPLWRATGTTATGLAERIYRRFMAKPIRAGWVRR